MAASTESMEPGQGRLSAFVQTLQQEADRRVGRKIQLETRWLEDLAQYHGVYDPDIDARLKESKKSRLFINLTRSKTNAMEARLSDMLFPTDDRNWGIGPTPVPELTADAEEAAQEAAKAAEGAVENPQNPQLQQQRDQAQQRLELIQLELEEARRRASRMEDEIDDHLRESKYGAQARDVIRDGCRLGTGIIKGPIVGEQLSRKWEAVVNEGGEREFQLKRDADKRPVFWRVDPWSYFPDMDATTHEQSESDYERHLFTKKQLRKLARVPGFDSAAIRRLIQLGASGGAPWYYAKLRSITDTTDALMKDRYQVWEYHGQLTYEDVQTIGSMAGKDEQLADIPEEMDPLEEIPIVAWFCQGELLKFNLHHMDSGESLYSIFNLEKDEASIFGYGLPYIMRHPQKALSAAWRALMDNMGLSAGPQIVINEKVIEPYDGEYILTPMKMWRRKHDAPPDKKPFEIFNIDSHLTDIQSVIDLCRRNIDEETGLPMLAQGEQGAQVTKTFQGMAILMNSVNVIFRRIVKNWDDDLTTPSIRRMYDWLMQFSPKEEIKGDYQVDARGTSVLLVREMQSQNLMAFLGNFVGHAILGKFLKEEGLPALRHLAKSMMLPADEVIKSETEIADDRRRRAGEPPPADPEMEKISAQLNAIERKGEWDLRVEKLRQETALITLAEQRNMKLDDLRAMLAGKKMETDSKERIFASEAAVEAQQAARGEDDKGSGGYLS